MDKINETKIEKLIEIHLNGITFELLSEIIENVITNSIDAFPPTKFIDKTFEEWMVHFKSVIKETLKINKSSLNAIFNYLENLGHLIKIKDRYQIDGDFCNKYRDTNEFIFASYILTTIMIYETKTPAM